MEDHSPLIAADNAGNADERPTPSRPHRQAFPFPRLWYNSGIMTATVERLADEVKSLPKAQLEEFLAWLVDYQSEHSDAWDAELERDSQPGGRLQNVLDRVRNDIAAGNTKPLDEVLHNA